VPHYFYLARCSDGSLYSGSCADLTEREEKHNAGKGAKYTRSRLPITFVYSEKFETKSEAMKREAAVKKLKKNEKEDIVLRKYGKRKKVRPKE
jgi:putative endonuclease